MNKEETEALVQRFIGYTRELTGPNVKRVPPFLFEISKDSRDHSPEVYNEVIILAFRAMNPAPKIAITRFGASVHSFWKAEKDLPAGIVPSVIKSWERSGDERIFCGRLLIIREPSESYSVGSTNKP